MRNRVLIVGSAVIKESRKAGVGVTAEVVVLAAALLHAAELVVGIVHDGG